jgi:hypothetical protein
MSEITGRPLMYDATLTWRRFDNFFALYDAAQNDPILIYVIGETHHCYIHGQSDEPGAPESRHTKVGLGERCSAQPLPGSVGGDGGG